MQKISLSKDQANQRIRRYCAYQERTQQEVRDKLYSFGLNKGAVEELLSNLILDNFLNEERFALLFAGGHFRIKQWGKIKIQHALQQKNISTANIKSALKSIDFFEYEKTLLSLAKKKWNSLVGEEALVRMAKTQSFLYQRGFETALVLPILNQLKSEL